MTYCDAEDGSGLGVVQGNAATKDSSLITSTTRRAEKRRTESSQGASWLGKRQRPAHEGFSEPQQEAEDIEDQENQRREAAPWRSLSGLVPSSLMQMMTQFASCQGLHLGTAASPSKQADSSPQQQQALCAAAAAAAAAPCSYQLQPQRCLQQQQAAAQGQSPPQLQGSGTTHDPQQQLSSSPPGSAALVCTSTVNSVSAATGTANTSCISPVAAGGAAGGAPDPQEVTGALQLHPIACQDAELTEEEDEEEEDDQLDPFVFISRLPMLESCVSGQRHTLLPRKTRNCKQKTLVLDLDETLVHSTLDASQSAGADFQFPVFFNGAEHQVYVRQRPYMGKFLEAVARHFEVVVFTASQKVYAEKLLNILDPKRNLIRHRIYRDSCVVVDGAYLKDLSVLGRDLANTAIVDNSPQAFGFQLDNGIPIESWYEDKQDQELLNLLPFLEELKDAADVRPLIQAKFRLRDKVDAIRSALAAAFINSVPHLEVPQAVAYLPPIPHAQAQQA